MKTLIKASFHLDIKLLKKALQCARGHENNIDGFINISFGKVETVADYYIEYGTEYDYLVINYGEEEQRIKLAESELTFGTRNWFLCDCDRRVAKLYQPLIFGKCRLASFALLNEFV